MTIWERLGIEPTEDVRTIKKAYAKQAKDCHQEDNPTEWQILHDAYEQALFYAKGEQNSQILVSSVETSDRKPINSRKHYPSETEFEAEAPKPFYSEFERINQHQEYLKNSIDYRTNMEYLKGIQNMKPKEQLQAWKEFLLSERIVRLYKHPDLWKEILLALEYFKYHKCVYQNLPLYLENIRLMNVDMSPQIIDIIKRVNYYCDKFKLGYRNQEIIQRDKIEKRNSHKSGIVIPILVVLAAFVCLCYVCTGIRNKNNLKKIVNEYYMEKYQEEVSLLDLEMKEIEEEGRYACYVENTKTGEVIFVTKDGECFDNRQVNDIQQDMYTFITEKLGLPEGAGVSLKGQYGSNTLCMCSEIVYHTKYEGDIEKFLYEEMEFRKEALKEYNGAMYPQGEAYNEAYVYFYPDANYKTVSDLMYKGKDVQTTEYLTQMCNYVYEEYGLDLAIMSVPEEIYKDLDIDSMVINPASSMCPIKDVFVTAGYWGESISTSYRLEDGTWIINEEKEKNTRLNEYMPESPNLFELENELTKNGQTWDIQISTECKDEVYLVFDERKYAVSGIPQGFKTESIYGFLFISVGQEKVVSLTVQPL